MNEHDFEQLLRRYALGDCTKEEKVLIGNWFQKIEVQDDFLLSRKEHDLTEQRILKSIVTKLEENNSYLKNKISTDGYLNTCLLYASTIEVILQI